MSNNTGVFGLSGYNDKNLEGLIADKTREAFREYGYFGGGGPGPLSTVDRIDYSNDSATAFVRGSLLTARSRFAATGNSNFGYFGGGGESELSVERLSYANDSVAAVTRGPLSVGRRELFGCGNLNFGYYGGGLQPGGVGNISSIDRIDYSNDSATSVVRNNLSSARFTIAATGNQNYGYTANAFGNVSLCQRIDYANDTSSLKSFGLLSSGRFAMGATGNSNFGYFGGGVPGPVRSTVDRIDYSNDSATASVRGPLSAARQYLAASSSQAFGGAPNTSTDPLPAYIRDATTFDDSNTLDLPFKRVLGSYGYWVGGNNPPISTVTRLDFSNDTANRSIRGPLSGSVTGPTAVSNSNFGYRGGSINNGSGSFPIVIDRIDFSNDNSTALVRNSLTSRADAVSSVSSPNFGYFGGGFFGPYLSRVERLNFSNDTQSLSQRGPLSSPKNNILATGNSNFGYFGGGSLGPLSTVDRINYSNDTATASIRGPLSAAIALSSNSATGNSNFGYFATTIVDRIDYSNDTTIASVRNSFSPGVQGTTGNSNFGYFDFGNIFRRLNFSNDTETASERSNGSGSNFNAATTNARSS